MDKIKTTNKLVRFLAVRQSSVNIEITKYLPHPLLQPRRTLTALLCRPIGKRFSLCGRSLSKLRCDAFGDLYCRALPTSSSRWFTNSLADFIMEVLAAFVAPPCSVVATSSTSCSDSLSPNSSSSCNSEFWLAVAKAEVEALWGSLHSSSALVMVLAMRRWHCPGTKLSVCINKAAGQGKVSILPLFLLSSLRLLLTAFSRWRSSSSCLRCRDKNFCRSIFQMFSSLGNTRRALALKRNSRNCKRLNCDLKLKRQLCTS